MLRLFHRDAAWSGATQPARIGFKVWADGQVYYLGSLQLVPHETRMIDLRKLRDAQEKDLEKHTIPAGATEGSVTWLRLDNVPVMGRLAVVTRHGGVASSYDCCYCACPAAYNYSVVVPANSYPLIVPTDDQMHDQEWFAPPCGGSYYYYDATSWVNWSSSNTSVFTLNSSNHMGLLSTVGGGTANAIAQGSSECRSSYQMGGSCLCSQWADPFGTTSCSVCDLSISSPSDGAVYSLGGSNYNQATVPLQATSACSGTANWTLSYTYTSRHATYNGSSTTTSTINQSSNYTTPAGVGGEVTANAQATLAGQNFSRSVTLYVLGTAIPNPTITSRLRGLYSGTTFGLLTGIAMHESGYHQFMQDSLMGVSGLWPYGNRVGTLDANVGLMQVQNGMAPGFNWFTNTYNGWSILQGKVTQVNRYVSGLQSQHPGLPDPSGTQYEDNALVLYGGYGSSNYIWVPNSTYTGWNEVTGTGGYDYVYAPANSQNPGVRNAIQ